MEQYLALDLGGTFLKYALMDETGAFLQQGKTPSPCGGMEQLLELIERAGQPFAGQYQGVALSMPGRIDTRSGIAHTGGNFTFIRDEPVGELLAQRLGVPVTVANDGKCAASAEAWNGALADVEDGVVIVLGTGTGGGIVLNHQVRLGHTFGAGELSCFGVDIHKLPDGIQKLGDNWESIWASYMSATGLLRIYGEQKGAGGALPGVDGLAFFRAYDAGEPEAHAALAEFGKFAAAGIYAVQAVLDVQRFAIGGGISARAEVTDAIRAAVDRQFGSIPFTPFGKPEIVPCRYGNDANLIGALSFHLNRVRGR